MDLVNALTEEEKIEIFLVLITNSHQKFFFNGQVIFFPISPNNLFKIEHFLRNKNNDYNYELIKHN